LISIDISNLVLKINIKTFDYYSFKLVNEFKWIKRKMIENSHRLYYQLKIHQLYDLILEDKINIQELFDNLCNKDDEYYTKLFTFYWKKDEIIENYDNDEIITLLLPYVTLQYNHLISSINIYNFAMVSLMIEYIQLDDTSQNFDLLKKCIQSKDFNIIKLILNKCQRLQDWGLLNEVIKYDVIINVFILFYHDNRINHKDMIKSCIEYENISILEYILKNQLEEVKEEDLLLAKDLNNQKIYHILCRYYN
jgi:hypothetical protein